MLYMVRSRVNRPKFVSDSDWEQLVTEESDYGIQARKDGHLVDIWRVSGLYAAFSVWDASDNDEFHRVLTGLPLYRYAEFEVTPLSTHPSTVRWVALNHAEEWDATPGS